MSENYLLINYLILFYQFYVHKLRDRGFTLNILTLSIRKQLGIKLKGLKKKLPNINLMQDPSILRKGFLLLWTPSKRCNRRG